MTDPDWADYLLRGLAGLSTCLTLFLGALLRYRSKRDAGAPADLGLD